MSIRARAFVCRRRISVQDARGTADLRIQATTSVGGKDGFESTAGDGNVCRGSDASRRGA